MKNKDFENKRPTNINSYAVEELREDKKSYKRWLAFQRQLPEEEKWRINKILGLIGEGIKIWRSKINN